MDFFLNLTMMAIVYVILVVCIFLFARIIWRYLSMISEGFFGGCSTCCAGDRKIRATLPAESYLTTADSPTDLSDSPYNLTRVIGCIQNRCQALQQARNDYVRDALAAQKS
jgi:hypothetical protein